MTTNFKAKIIIKGTIKLLTGLHIGGGDKDSGIGEIDYVIKDPKTGQPIIPGSSIKGKIRSSLELLVINDMKDGKVHACNINDCQICRLLGTSAEKAKNRTRLIVRDAKLNNAAIVKEWETNLLYTEIKTENNINRLTAKAEPRCIERVPAGAEFDLEMVYTYDYSDEKNLKEDFKNIKAALDYIQDDYLGGNGSRGYGRVKFSFKEPEIRCKAYYTGKEEDKITCINKETREYIEGLLPKEKANV
ncbi:MAG: type III-A CRISPR-associated RAMP protein Csm3 [bacterium]